MAAQPTRRRIEPGIYERIGADGERRGLEIYYKDVDGRPRRRSVTGGLADARDALAEARTRRVKHEREPLDPRATFGAVCDAYEATHVASLRPNSQTVRRAALKRLRAEFGARRITQIGRADIRRFVNGLSRELKANSVLAYYSTLRGVFSFAASDLDIPVAFPRLKPGELPDPVDDQREKRILADDELARVLAACDPRTRLFFQTLAETGARASEALGLTPREIGDGTIAFRHQLGKDGATAPLKSRQSRRTIEIRRGLAAELRLRGAGRVFEPLTLDAAEKRWHAILDRAAIEDPRPVIHDLRHTHVSGLIADGWDVVEVAARVGDRVETVLRVYAHEFDAKRRSAARRASLEERYGRQDGYQMATHTPSQAITHTPEKPVNTGLRDVSAHA